jgi:hypothetical protein
MAGATGLEPATFGVTGHAKFNEINGSCNTFDARSGLKRRLVATERGAAARSAWNTTRGLTQATGEWIMAQAGPSLHFNVDKKSFRLRYASPQCRRLSRWRSAPLS